MKTVDPDRFTLIRQIFEQVIELPAEQRSAWLEHKCADDSIRSEVVALLTEMDRSDDPLEAGALRDTAMHAAESTDVFPQINGYQLLRRIAVGGQAVVFEAIQESTRQTVAVKLLRGGQLSTPEESARFAREVSSLASIQHPHIVPIIDRGKTADGVPFLATQFVSGFPIDRYFLRKRSDGRPSPGNRKLLRVFIKIARAVSVAHEKGIIHRDLKPSNILIDENGEPRILDFGLAKNLHPGATDPSMTSSGGFLGTLPWASPEQARLGVVTDDHRTDIYSLGVILYHLLTDGAFPYDVVGEMCDVLDNIVNEAPISPASRMKTTPAKTDSEDITISPALEQIVLKTLEKSPDRRFQSAAELASAIEDCLDGKMSTLIKLSDSKSARRRRWAVTAVGIVAVAVTTVLIWGQLHSHNPRALATLDNSDDQAESAARREEAADLNAMLHSFSNAGDQLQFLLDKGRYKQALELYDLARRTHRQADGDHTRLMFQHATKLDSAPIQASTATEAAVAIYRSITESHRGVHRNGEMLDVSAESRVRLARHLVNQEPEASCFVQLYEGMSYLRRLCRNHSPRDEYVSWYIELRRLTARMHLKAGNAGHAIFLLELPHWIDRERLGADHDFLVDHAFLVLSLPAGEDRYRTAEQNLRKLKNNDGSRPGLAAAMALADIRLRQGVGAAEKLAKSAGLNEIEKIERQLIGLISRREQMTDDWRREFRSIDKSQLESPQTIREFARMFLLQTADAYHRSFSQWHSDRSRIGTHFTDGRYLAVAGEYRRAQPMRHLYDGFDLRTIVSRIERQFLKSPGDREVLPLASDGLTEEEATAVRELALAIRDGNRIRVPNDDSSIHWAYLRATIRLALSADNKTLQERIAELYLSRGAFDQWGNQPDSFDPPMRRGLATIKHELGLVLTEAGWFEEAIVQFTEAAEDFRRFKLPLMQWESRFQRLWVEIVADQEPGQGYDDAFRRLSELEETGSGRTRFLTLFGAAHYRCGRIDAARTALHTALQADPNQPVAVLFSAMCDENSSQGLASEICSQMEALNPITRAVACEYQRHRNNSGERPNR